MQSWMITLIVMACAVAVIAAAFLIGSLVAVHTILGRRVEMSEKKRAKKGYIAKRFGVDIEWFDTVKQYTTTVGIKSYDGLSLKALLIKHSDENSARVAVCCHGYGATPRSMQVQARLLYNRGFDVLLPAMRGHAMSEGKVGMAWLDRFDLLRWLDRLIGVYGKDISIALCGVSMGGATVIAASGMGLPSQVKCVIDDCGFSSQYDEYSACLSGIPLPKSLALLPLAVGVRLVHGYSIRSADITKLAAEMTIPALFIHGEADAFVPCALGRKLYEACASSEKKFYSVPNAEHACAYVVDKQGYVDVFASFVESHIPCECVVDEPDVPVEPDPPAPENAEDKTEKAETPTENTEADAAAAENAQSENALGTEQAASEEKTECAGVV